MILWMAPPSVVVVLLAGNCSTEAYNMYSQKHRISYSDLGPGSAPIPPKTTILRCENLISTTTATRLVIYANYKDIIEL